MLQHKQFFAYQHPLCWEYLQHTEAPIHWLILVLLKDRHWLGTSQNLVPGSELWKAKVERHPFLQERDAKIQPATHTTVPTAAFPACTDTDACPSETEFLANTLLSLLTWKESLYQKGSPTSCLQCFLPPAWKSDSLATDLFWKTPSIFRRCKKSPYFCHMGLTSSLQLWLCLALRLELPSEPKPCFCLSVQGAE